MAFSTLSFIFALCLGAEILGDSVANLVTIIVWRIWCLEEYDDVDCNKKKRELFRCFEIVTFIIYLEQVSSSHLGNLLSQMLLFVGSLPSPKLWFFKQWLYGFIVLKIQVLLYEFVIASWNFLLVQWFSKEMFLDEY